VRCYCGKVPGQWAVARKPSGHVKPGAVVKCGESSQPLWNAVGGTFAHDTIVVWRICALIHSQVAKTGRKDSL
jgi:hypothetical protein